MTAFIRHIEFNLCEDMDAEVYASFKHAMDGRNIYDRQELEEMGFAYTRIGEK